MKTIVYRAPKPKVPTKQILKKIALRVILPPVLLWDAVKWVMSRGLGEWLGKKIVPAQSAVCKRGYDDELKSPMEQLAENLSVNKTSVITHDGAILDGVELLQPNSDKYIIYFASNGFGYEDILPLIINYQSLEQSFVYCDLIHLQCNMVFFNYRNVGQSTGVIKSQYDLLTDGIAQVQRLLAKGVCPERIYLSGISLGAALCPLVAAHFAKFNIHINTFSLNPFSSISNVVTAWLRRKKDGDNTNGYTETTRGKIKATLAYPIVKLVLKGMSWDINIVSKYQSLPALDKEYMFVRSARAAREGDDYPPIDDVVIPHYASLHAALKRERTVEKRQLDKAIEMLTQTEIPNIKGKKLTSLKEARSRFKQRKMITQNPDIDGHRMAINFMLSRHDGTSAQNFFWKFFKQKDSPAGSVAIAEPEHKQNSELRVARCS